MRYSKEDIINTAPDLILEDHVHGNHQYEWVDQIGITQRPQDLQSSLYFATHLEGTDGWHNAVDRRPYASKVAQDKGWHLAVEPGTETGNAPHIVVESLTELSTRLYQDARAKSKPYVVGVTGSVGKTTTVAFLEHLLRTGGYEVTRFWSKRLTPFLIECHYINRVETDTPFVVMEYSTYKHDHVGILAEKLPPNIAFLTNIYDTHINPSGFRDRADIFESKKRIKPDGSLGLVSQTVLDDLGIQAPEGWQQFIVDQQLVTTNTMLPPTLRTAEMHTVGRRLAEEIGIPFEIFKRAFETFTPQERRVLTCQYNGRNIFFDGEATYGSRQWSWFETIDGNSPTLLVESVNFGDEDPNGQRKLLEKIFGSEDTFVLDTPENRERLIVNAQFVCPIEFADRLNKRAGDYLVYHKALATRQADFDPTKYLQQAW